MGLYNKLPDDIGEVDVIIAGGKYRHSGTTACVVASRLSDAYPDISILMIEGGQNNANYPTIAHPAFFLTHLAPGSSTSLFYKTKKSAAVADRELILPSGGVLGGGSSTNFMMYSRAQKSDYDSWGVPGWSGADMLPYLKKFETYHGKDEKNVHGNDGPIHISRGTYGSRRIEDEFIASAAKVGWSEVQDVQDLETVNTVGRAYRYISPDGWRQDAATCYLHPRLNDGKHPNLHVLVETQVKRILFDNNKAVGVEFRHNPAFGGNASQIQTVKARRLVIASCGACGTPSLLERSGMGDPKVLQAAGVPLVVESPGVGNGYEDHHLVLYPYLNSLDPTDTLDALVYGRMGSPEELIKDHHPMLGWNAQEVQGKVRPTDAEAAALGPEFKKAWDREFKDHPEKPMVIFTVVGGFPGDPSLATGGPGLAISTFTAYPFSQGHIHITGPQLEDPLDFETGFFADPGGLDIKKHVWTYKKQREVMRRMPSYRGEMAACHPPFAPGSGAASISLADGPLPADAPDIEYSAEDDAVIEKWLRENVSTTWHSLGTCKMLPRDQNGVVDANLGVYGAERLKIADMSIVPRNVAANTNSTALAIGEKAADIFIKELRMGLE
ncbi:Glucose-methanol-choline oxidoreductase N-terminal domain-containing protein [Madurella fahalii]|uniref:Glucose-methanol-choline oxidoreductase N-terminal domain-containing protein n=1 Tax=Madurella fahalii TaxID=1157608 RepID=A0ABQ0G564_9PEZI